ncbi:MAG: hypothetical protein IJG50_00790 [Clostridia bacterium]|nr:hypothetical protein [Clostridia bacterium]
MKAKNILTIILIISLFSSIFLVSGCSWIFAESEEPAEETYADIIGKINSTTKKVTLVFCAAKKNADKQETEKFLSEKDVSFSYLSGAEDRLILKHDNVNYLVEPTLWFTGEQTDKYTFVDNTRWGSVVCVDMASFSSFEQFESAVEELIYVYRYAGYEIVPPYELYISNESLGFEDDADPANYPSLTTSIPLGIEESNPVNDAYFNDAVFIGDSITQKLQMYVTQMRREESGFMGEAKFLCSTSLGASNALSEVTTESLHPSYNGVKRTIWENVAQTGAKKVYIMLGVNDLTWASITLTVSNLRTLIDEIKAASPDVQIYIQSVTPRIAGFVGEPDNKKIFEYNLELYKMCREEGYYFVDVAYALRDENGCLPDELCSDLNSLGIHFTNEACRIWVKYLRTHTP